MMGEDEMMIFWEYFVSYSRVLALALEICVFIIRFLRMALVGRSCIYTGISRLLVQLNDHVL